MKKKIEIVLAILVLLIMSAFAYYWFCMRSTYTPYQPEEKDEEPQMPRFNDSEEFGTNGIFVWEEFLDVEPRILGRWESKDAPRTFRVYTNENADDGYCWGWEWNEADDVYEDDLQYHGNGWFRWKIEKKSMTELHCMDMGETEIPVLRKIQKLDNSNLAFKEGVLFGEDNWKKIN